MVSHADERRSCAIPCLRTRSQGSHAVPQRTIMLPRVCHHLLGDIRCARIQSLARWLPCTLRQSTSQRFSLFAVGRVMTVSFHRYGLCFDALGAYPFFPGTGELHDVGERHGKNYSVNVPLKVRDIPGLPPPFLSPLQVGIWVVAESRVMVSESCHAGWVRCRRQAGPNTHLLCHEHLLSAVMSNLPRRPYPCAQLDPINATWI